MVATLTDKVKFIQSILGGGRLSRGGTNLDVWCPFCNHSRDKKKLSIRLSDDANHCWTCDWKARSLVALVKKFGSREQLIEYRDKFLPEDRKKSFSLDDDEPSVPKLPTLPSDFRLLALGNRKDPNVLAALRYVTGRGLTERDLWYFKLGTSDEPRWRRRVIVPSFDDEGTVNYFVARAVDGQKKPKYDNPDYDKSQIIFNEINVDWSKQLVLCEGAFDMFKCGENTVPLLGSSLNEQSRLFNAIIAHGTPVALALDADMIEKRTPELARKLSEYDVDVTIVDVRPHPDPGKMTREQFRDCLKASRGYTWMDTFSSRLSRATRTSLHL